MDKYSYFGIFMSVMAFIMFTFLLVQLAGGFGYVLGPIIALAALRPPEGSDKWGWHKHNISKH